MDLLILCCFGGVPFIEFPLSSSQKAQQQQNVRHQWDPTDWVATDMSGSLLNGSSNSGLLLANPSLKRLIPPDLPHELSLEQCDLWNLTFASGADEHVFRRSWGKLRCRCPREFAGSACHQREKATTTTTNKNNNNNISVPTHSSPIISTNIFTPTTMAFFSSTPLPTALASAAAAVATDGAGGAALAAGLSRHENSFSMFLLVFMFLAAAMVALFLMLRGCCFCDCFGGCSRSNRRRYDQPLDRQTVSVCMEAIRAHEQNEKNKWAAHGQWSTTPPPPPAAASLPSSTYMVVDSRRPLLPQSPVAGGPSSHLPSVSECVPMAPPRACSPPPSYRSLNASLEQLPGGAPQNTKI